MASPKTIFNTHHRRTSATGDLQRLYAFMKSRLQANKAGPLSPLRTSARTTRDLCVAATYTRRYAPAVAAAYGIGIGRQLLQLVQLNLRYGFTADDYFRFRLYRLSSEQAALFVPLKTNIAMRSQLYQWLALNPKILADKRLFGRACMDAGLPVATTVADFSNGTVRWWFGDALPPADLFVKEAASLCGDGAALWAYEPAGQWSNGGTTLDAHGLTEQLAKVSRNAPLLLQRRLRNHSSLTDIAPIALCTVRVVTIRAPESATSDVLLAAFRMAIGNDVADNFARGGLACAVDLATGTLGTAARKALNVAHLDLDRHPDTDAPIRRRRLPLWRETLDLARRAHDVFPQFPSIGWDVALTADGPVLLEANYNWDVVLGQQAGCRPLGATRWPEHFLSWLEWGELKREALAEANAQRT